MRNKLLLIFSLVLLPLVLGWGVAKAADQQDTDGFTVALRDGSLVNGTMSLVINLDTPYGQIKIPSSSLVSARFDVQQKWADIQLNDAQLKLRYNPASSDLKATTAAGPLSFALSNVSEIAKGTVEVASGTSPKDAVSQNTPPPAYTQQQPPVTYQNPYQYSYPYQYAQPAPYYDYYDYAPYYGYGSYYPYYYGYGWPYYGLGFGWGGFYGGFGRGFGGFHGGGFGGFHGGGFGGFHGGGGGFHGGGGGHGR